MSHIQHFDVEDAVKYGVEVAILLQYFRTNLRENKVNNKHIYDRYVWVQFSFEALTQLFPYFKLDKIKRILYKMESEKIVVTGDFVATSHSHSKWYSLQEFCNDHSMETYIAKNNIKVSSFESNDPAPNTQFNQESFSEQRGYSEASSVNNMTWSEIMPVAIKEQVTKLKMQHGYDDNFYLDIWNTFAAKMDADDEPITTMDFTRKRFMAYAQAVMLKFKQGTHRYNSTTDRNATTRQNLVNKWQNHLGKPNQKIIEQLDLRQLKTPIGQVWDSFINKNFEKEVPLKNIGQLESGFKLYVAAWIKNENKKGYTQGVTKQDYEDTSWADNLILK